MTQDEIVTQVNAVLEEGFEIDSSLITPEARLGEDLGLDSLDGVDLVVALEKRIGCEVDEETARAMRTVKHIYDHISDVAKSHASEGGD